MNPWEVLGVDRAGATVESVREAKRRLAKLHHPDVVAGGGGASRAVADASARLALVNRAAELALAELAASARLPVPPPGTAPRPPPGREQPAEASFTIDFLPVEAFELLRLAFWAIGDPKVIEEPYLLEGQVDDPSLGFARVELAPEAGGSLVTVSTWASRRAPALPPSAAEVAGRLLWEVGNLAAG